jgi:hypothetical protein
MQLPRKMPNLTGALKRRGPHGMCIHRAAGFVLDVPGSELCFGTFRAATPEEAAALGPSASLVPFIHAWAEWQGWVIAPTTIERTGGRLVPMEPGGYYRANGARDIYRLTRPKLLQVAREIGLSRHLRLGLPTKGEVSVGSTLMDAAGVPYTLTPDGGIVPAPKED